MAIIITAYNRPQALKNLLCSLDRLQCDREKAIPLIISIDNNGTDEVNKIAYEYNWKNGEKKVIVHDHKIGLRDHFIWVGDQTEVYENVIFLEDDLVVSPQLTNFAEAAIAFYQDDDETAGVSFYNPILCEFNGCKFYQNQDGYDVYFLQHPYWGNIWSKNKWREFKAWMVHYKPNYNIIPKAVASWRDTSFKKVFIQYLVEKNKYIAVPRISLLTNNGEAGLHNEEGLYQYQTPLMNESFDYRFCRFSQSKAVYDAYMEILPSILQIYNRDLEKFDFEVDLKGNRHQYNKEYVLTTRKSQDTIMTFTSLMKPMENGVIYPIKGNGISLCRSSDVIFDKRYEAIRLYKDIDSNYIISVKNLIPTIKAVISKKIRRVINASKKTS